MHYQVFVKGLDGRTKCLQTSSARLEIKTLKEKLSDLLKIPPEFQRLVSGTRQIADEGFIIAENDGFLPQINVLLRLRAGKGGFGSLLRGAATKAGQKKTNNNDACRDMSGRRLRHVNAEKKLEEWKAEAEERQLEKIAEAYLKKQMKAKKKADPKLDNGAKDVEKYRVEASRAMDNVENAVLEALKSHRNGKRKVEDDVEVKVKRHKLWVLEEEDEVEEDKDSDEEIEDAKHDECLIKGDEECGSSHISNSESASGSGISSPSEIGSPGSGSCDDREASGKFEKKDLKSLAKIVNCLDGREISNELDKEMAVALISTEGKNITHANIHHNSEANVEVKTEEPNSSYGENDSGSGEEKASIDINKEAPVVSYNVDGQNIISCNMDEIEIMSNMAGRTSHIPDSDRSSSEGNFGSKSIITNASVEIDSVCDSNSNSKIGEELNFDTFNTAKDMEVLGLERLKNELQSSGLKCGGSLSERAARLFLLKTTPLEKLPKKHFAKSKDVGN